MLQIISFHCFYDLNIRFLFFFWNLVAKYSAVYEKQKVVYQKKKKIKKIKARILTQQLIPKLNFKCLIIYSSIKYTCTYIIKSFFKVYFNLLKTLKWCKFQYLSLSVSQVQVISIKSGWRTLRKCFVVKKHEFWRKFT